MYYELSLGEGLTSVDRTDAGSRGQGLATKDLEVDAGLGLELGSKDGSSGTLHVKPAEPIKVDSNGVGLKYDTNWFDVVNGELTFKEAQLKTLIEGIISTALSTASVQVGAQGDIMNVTAAYTRMIRYDTAGTISLDGSSGEVVTDVYGVDR